MAALCNAVSDAEAERLVSRYCSGCGERPHYSVAAVLVRLSRALRAVEAPSLALQGHV